MKNILILTNRTSLLTVGHFLAFPTPPYHSSLLITVSVSTKKLNRHGSFSVTQWVTQHTSFPFIFTFKCSLQWLIGLAQDWLLLHPLYGAPTNIPVGYPIAALCHRAPSALDLQVWHKLMIQQFINQTDIGVDLLSPGSDHLISLMNTMRDIKYFPSFVGTLKW